MPGVTVSEELNCLKMATRDPGQGSSTDTRPRQWRNDCEGFAVAERDRLLDCEKDHFVCHAGLELDDTLSGRETLSQYVTDIYFRMLPGGFVVAFVHINLPQ